MARVNYPTPKTTNTVLQHAAEPPCSPRALFPLFPSSPLVQSLCPAPTAHAECAKYSTTTPPPRPK